MSWNCACCAEGPGGSLPASAPGDVLVSDGAGGWTGDPALLPITQAAWFVNSITGNDASDGATEATALLTTTELQRRFVGRIFSVSATVQFRGTFTAQNLKLSGFVLPEGLPLTVLGDTPTIVASDSIAAYTAMAPGTATANQLQSVGLAFAGHAQRRGRLTSGADTGALFWILLDLGGNVARISQPARDNGTTAVFVTPGAGATFAVETLVTAFAYYDINVYGGGSVTVRDCEFRGAATSGNSWAFANGARRVWFDGCQFTTNAHVVRGLQLWMACSNSASLSISGPLSMVSRAGAHFAQVAPTQAGCQLSLQMNTVFQGIGSAPFPIAQNAQVFSGATAGQSHIAFYDCTAGTLSGIIRIDAGCHMEMVAADAVLWGIGNVGAAGIGIVSGNRFVYQTKPTLTGNIAGQDVNVGGTIVAYAGVPYVEPANLAMIVARAGA